MGNELKIVRVLNGNYEVVINGGTKNNVRNGQIVLFYELGEMIEDPDTGEELGFLEIILGKGEVIHAQEKISTVTSLDTVAPRRTPGMVGLIQANDEKVKKPFTVATVGSLAKIVRN